jgi:Ca2+-binding RTX toxin-like protein
MKLEELMDLPLNGESLAAEKDEPAPIAQELQDLLSDLTTLDLEQLMNIRLHASESEEEEDKDEDEDGATAIAEETETAEDPSEQQPAAIGGGGADFTSFETVVVGEALFLAMAGERGRHDDDEVLDALSSPIPLDEESETVQLNLVEPDSEPPPQPTLTGGPGDDFLVGGPDSDSIIGFGGNDQLVGSGGDDTLDGGRGVDILTGGSGNDLLLGGGGNDQLDGGLGNDLLDGGPGKDMLTGGSGNDVIVWDFPDAVADGGAGSDVLRVVEGDVDLTNFKGTIAGIEIIDLSADPDPNALTLTPQQVLDVSDTDVLTVLGENGDSIDAGSGWTYGGRDGDGQDVYTQSLAGSLATLILDPDLITNPDIVS